MYSRLMVGVAVAALCVGCESLPTHPDSVSPQITSLGFLIEASPEFTAAGGSVTSAHAALADRFWIELMHDLTGAGLQLADPNDLQGNPTIFLMQPQTPTGNILYSDGVTLVGSYYRNRYGQASFFVPGNYPTAQWPKRSNAQPLKHEYLHHWCIMALRQDCLAPGTEWSDPGSHTWYAPNGVNVWDLTWE